MELRNILISKPHSARIRFSGDTGAGRSTPVFRLGRGIRLDQTRFVENVHDYADYQCKAGDQGGDRPNRLNRGCACIGSGHGGDVSANVAGKWPHGIDQCAEDDDAEDDADDFFNASEAERLCREVFAGQHIPGRHLDKPFLAPHLEKVTDFLHLDIHSESKLLDMSLILIFLKVNRAIKSRFA